MYFSGKQSSAVSPGDSSKKAAVCLAEARMAVLETSKGFGAPVEPEVCSVNVVLSLSQASKKNPNWRS